MSGKLLTKKNSSGVAFVALFFILSSFAPSINAQTYNINTIVGEWRLRAEDRVFRVNFTKNGDQLEGAYYGDDKKLRQMENVFFVTVGGKSYIRFQLTEYGYFDLQVKTNKKCEGTTIVFANERTGKPKKKGVGATMTK